jgi:hypothetical protein
MFWLVCFAVTCALVVPDSLTTWGESRLLSVCTFVACAIDFCTRSCRMGDEILMYKLTGVRRREILLKGASKKLEKRNKLCKKNWIQFRSLFYQEVQFVWRGGEQYALGERRVLPHVHRDTVYFGVWTELATDLKVQDSLLLITAALVKSWRCHVISWTDHGYLSY